MPAGSARGSPSVCSRVGSPAAIARRTRSSTWTRLGCGASARSSSCRRSTPSSRRSSVSASRPVVSAVANAVAGPLGIAVGEPPRRAGLDRHRRDGVRHDVVQLAGDPRALPERGGLRLGGTLALELRGLLHERVVERLAVAHQLPEDERAADRDDPREHEGLHLVGVRVGGDGRGRERQAGDAREPQAPALEAHPGGERHEQDREERADHALADVRAGERRVEEAAPRERRGDERRPAAQRHGGPGDQGEPEAEQLPRALELPGHEHLAEDLERQQAPMSASSRYGGSARRRDQDERATAAMREALCRAPAGPSSSAQTIAASSQRRRPVHTAVMPRIGTPADDTGRPWRDRPVP